MKCKICGSDSPEIFQAMVLNKYSVKYFRCNNCGFIFTESPYWLKEAYASAINLSDTGILERNIYFSKIISSIIYFLFDKNSLCLDYAGGYGIFTRLMRDSGFNFFWQDLYCENLLAKGFEYKADEMEKPQLVTALEVFEHLENPVDEIKNISALSTNIIFSTVLLPENIPDKSWWYYGFEHGQHLSFYTATSLEMLAKKFNLNYYSTGGIHIFTAKDLNKTALFLLALLNKAGLFHLVKTLMQSKTMEDHHLLKNIHKG